MHREAPDWRAAAWNLLGSLLFLAAAFAAFVRPATGDALDASLANSGTLTGALCFLAGARLPADSSPRDDAPALATEA